MLTFIYPGFEHVAHGFRQPNRGFHRHPLKEVLRIFPAGAQAWSPFFPSPNSEFAGAPLSNGPSLKIRISGP